jgi:hypothetical protein
METVEGISISNVIKCGLENAEERVNIQVGRESRLKIRFL